MSNAVTLICYGNGKVVDGKKEVSYEGPPPTSTIIRSSVIFEEFMDKLYHVTGYEK